MCTMYIAILFYIYTVDFICLLSLFYKFVKKTSSMCQGNTPSPLERVTLLFVILHKVWGSWQRGHIGSPNGNLTLLGLLLPDF